MGRSAESLGMPILAVWLLKEARQQAPTDLTILRALARLCERLERYAAAAAVWHQVHQVNPSDLEATTRRRSRNCRLGHHCSGGFPRLSDPPRQKHLSEVLHHRQAADKRELFKRCHPAPPSAPARIALGPLHHHRGGGRLFVGVAAIKNEQPGAGLSIWQVSIAGVFVEQVMKLTVPVINFVTTRTGRPWWASTRMRASCSSWISVRARPSR